MEVRPDLRREIYDVLIEQTHAVGERTLDRLRLLQDRFPSELPREVIDGLEEFHARPRQEPGDDRRCAPRFPGMRETVLIADPLTPEATREADVLDRSWVGLRFHADRPVKVGAVLVLNRPDADESPAFAEVRHCAAADGGWEIGCEFLRV